MSWGVGGAGGGWGIAGFLGTAGVAGVGGEKNSSASSIDSISPSNWNVPQMNRTAGGTIVFGSSSFFLAVMKLATFWVSFRTSRTPAWAGGSTPVTSNQSCTLSLVVPWLR